MEIKIINHELGEQIPLMLDSERLPIVLPNEFILSRRSLSTKLLLEEPGKSDRQASG